MKHLLSKQAEKKKGRISRNKEEAKANRRGLRLDPMHLLISLVRSLALELLHNRAI